MTRKSNSQQDGQNGAAPAQEPNAAAPVAEYKVGPGCPPKEYQFKKGQSGNPRGAKRKVPSLVPDLKKLLEQVLGRKITVPVGDKKHTLTWYAAGIEQLGRQYVKGDRHARKEIFEMAAQVGLDLHGMEKKALEEALTANQQAMLYEYVAKQYDLVAPRPPVLAPAALLDDDTEDPNQG
jgi:Family of unknown function (DUF5681)